MKNNNKLLKYSSLFFAYLPAVVYALVYSKLPDQIATNFDLSGNVNAYSSKFSFILMPLLSIGLYYLMMFMPKLDPKKKNYEKFGDFYFVFILLMLILLDVMFFATIATAFEYDFINISVLVSFSIGMLFIFIGNSMPKIKHNYTMGFKTPWTLASEKVWNKTHRLSGYLFIICGITFLINSFFLSTFTMILVGISVVSLVLIPAVMSYRWFKEEKSVEE